MYIEQFFEKGLSHSSYILGSGDECAVIDPQRDIEIYLKKAGEMGMRITLILETHLHADFVSGHLELREKTGAKVYAPKSAKCAFPHTGVAEKSKIRFKDICIDVIETPGHTPEHVTYVVTDKSRSDKPCAIFCGDTLFVGDVGRPDLFPKIAEKLAERLFDSLKKITSFSDDVLVFPAHGAGSLCGRAIGANRVTTVGYERKYNRSYLIKNKKSFIVSLTNNMPSPPDHFSRCSEINRQGPRIASKMKKVSPLVPGEFYKKSLSEDYVIIDTRDFISYGGAHVDSSYSIDINGKFSTFSGWVIPPDKKILLVSEDSQQAETAVKLLRRVGLDSVEYFLEGNLFEWAKKGLPLKRTKIISARDINIILKSVENCTVIDVRAKQEYEAGHLKEAINIPAPDLRKRHRELDRDSNLILLCSTGHRSSLAASILEQHNFKNTINVAGGMTAYNNLSKNQREE